MGRTQHRKRQCYHGNHGKTLACASYQLSLEVLPVVFVFSAKRCFVATKQRSNLMLFCEHYSTYFSTYYKVQVSYITIFCAVVLREMYEILLLCWAKTCCAKQHLATVTWYHRRAILKIKLKVRGGDWGVSGKIITGVTVLFRVRSAGNDKGSLGENWRTTWKWHTVGTIGTEETFRV